MKNSHCPACQMEMAGVKSRKALLHVCAKKYNELSYASQKKLNESQLTYLEKQFNNESDLDRQLDLISQINALRIKIKALSDRISGTSRTALDTYSMPATSSFKVPYN